MTNVIIFSTGWSGYLKRHEGMGWQNLYESWIKSGKPIHAVIYNRLVNNTQHELEQVSEHLKSNFCTKMKKGMFFFTDILLIILIIFCMCFGVIR